MLGVEQKAPAESYKALYILRNVCHCVGGLELCIPEVGMLGTDRTIDIPFDLGLPGDEVELQHRLPHRLGLLRS